MALSVLDGNQSATTLSSVVTGGEHIVAHSVVSLGSNAISNITTAISGSTVCVGNLGLLQSTVATEGLSASGSFIKIGGHTGTSTTGNIVHVSAVGALRVDGSSFTQPVSISSVTIGNTVTIAGTVTANPTGTQTIAGTVTVGQIQGYQHASTATIGPFNADVMLVGEDIEAAYAAGLVVIPAARGGGVLGGRTASGDTPICVYGDNGSAVTISGTVTIGSALPAGTNRIGVVTIGAGTVTLGAGTAQIGSVTIGNISSLPDAGNNPVIRTFMFGYNYDNETPIAIASDGTALSVAGSVAIGSALPAGTAQIGSVTASISNSVTIASLPAISGTVTANTFALQGTAVTTSNFTSTTASTVLAGFNAGREVLTIFNEGAGNLHICAGATCTTIAYQVRLSAGDYYEVPNHQTTITHSAVFATAGTARVTQVS